MIYEYAVVYRDKWTKELGLEPLWGATDDDVEKSFLGFANGKEIIEIVETGLCRMA